MIALHTRNTFNDITTHVQSQRYTQRRPPDLKKEENTTLHKSLSLLITLKHHPGFLEAFLSRKRGTRSVKRIFLKFKSPRKIVPKNLLVSLIKKIFNSSSRTRDTFFQLFFTASGNGFTCLKLARDKV